MKLIDRYIGRVVVAGALIALMIILSLNVIFEFVDETGDVGRGDYTTGAAFVYVLLSLPYRAYEAFPFATLIGALMALGGLAARQELVAMRAAGVSVSAIARAVLLAGVALAMVAMVLGELLAPPAERMAQALRSAAIEGSAGARAGDDLWIRDGRHMLNAEAAPAADLLESVTVYEVDGTRVVRMLVADNARYQGSEWWLGEVVETRFEGERVARRAHDTLRLSVGFRPDTLEVVVVDPMVLPVRDILAYIDYLESNGLETDRYWLAIWVRVATPLSTLAMLMLTVPLVTGSQRGSGAGQRLFIGVIVGLAFFLLNRLLANAGVVYGLPPAFSALAPTVLFLGLGVWGLSRAR